MEAEMSKFSAPVAALLSAFISGSMAQTGNYLDDIARLDAQIAIQRKQIEARDLAVQAAGRINLPTVRYVSGFDDDLTAVVGYGQGRRFTVKRGDVLPGGIEVKSVRQNGVLVVVGKQPAVLEFSVAEEGTPAAAQQREQQAGLMPPLPQVNVPLPGSIGHMPEPARAPAAAPSVPVAAQKKEERVAKAPDTQPQPAHAAPAPANVSTATPTSKSAAPAQATAQPTSTAPAAQAPAPAKEAGRTALAIGQAPAAKN